MSDNDVAAARVVAVLLADGWHRIVGGSFSVSPQSLGADPAAPGFRFEEADVGSPNQPTLLAGPLDSIIAVRQAVPTVRHAINPDWALVAHVGHQANQGARLPVPASR